MLEETADLLIFWSKILLVIGIAMILAATNGCSTNYTIVRVGAVCFNVNSQCIYTENPPIDNPDAGR